MRALHYLAVAISAGGLAVLGCASLIGIEDVKQDSIGASQEGGTASMPDGSVSAPDGTTNAIVDGSTVTGVPCPGGPKPRDCDSADDNNCDGLPDNTVDATCQCNSAHPTGTCTGTNNCPGTRACGANHKLATTCDAPASCDCNPGDTGTCTGGANNCAGGTQTCGTNHKWSTCTGAPAHCECKAGDTRPCTAIDGAWPCGSAPCKDGQWDTTACTPATQWCQDLDGDGACSSVCVTACTGPANTKKNCPPSDCNDSSATINPTTPESCAGATSCVTQAYVYSQASGKCDCTSTGTATNEGAACAANSVCMGGTCTCNSGAPCQVGCLAGNVSCILGPACKTTGNAPAGTACGTASVCNGSNVCYTNCTLGNPKCNLGTCVGGSVTMNCTEGSVCNITWASVGAICQGTGHCLADHTCMQ